MELIKEVRRVEFVQAQVTCLTCGQQVRVKMVPFGDGYVAVCPQSGHLAYSADRLPA